MNIVLSTDDNFVQHCCVTITSILEHNCDVTFFLLTEGLLPDNELLLKRQVEKYGSNLVVCKVDSEIIRKFPMPSKGSAHITVATYFRLLVEWLLPESVDKVIYLDCDIVVRGSLKELWETPLDGKAIGAVFQSQESNKLWKSSERLGYSVEDGYFNAGVLLINLAYWKKNNTTNLFLEFIRKNYDIILAHDQDVLNATLHECVLELDNKWNYYSAFMSNKNDTFPKGIKYGKLSNPNIVHFVNRPKCWEYGCRNPFAKEYYTYLDKTIFAGWRPAFSQKAFIKYRLVSFVVRLDIFCLRKLFRH